MRFKRPRSLYELEGDTCVPNSCKGYRFAWKFPTQDFPHRRMCAGSLAFYHLMIVLFSVLQTRAKDVLLCQTCARDRFDLR